jgi:hypothetical protein
MESTPFTVRNVAKYAVKAAVQTKVAITTKHAIVDYTRFEEDDTVTSIGSHLVGWYVSDKVKPYTDKAVDKTADFITKKRAERAAKKDQTPES